MILRTLAAVAALVMVAGLPSPSEAAAADYVVGFHALPQSLRAGDDFHGARVTGINRAIDFITVRAGDPTAFEARARADARVRYVEPDPVMDLLADVDALLTPNDPRFSSQYGPQQIRAPLAWDTTLGSTDAAVCVVDTGVRASHEDLAGARFLGWRDFVGGGSSPYDDNGHGTHVAGIAAAWVNNARGIAGVGNVGLYGVKVLDSGGSGTWSTVANGITWCADNTVARTVISMSLGGSSGAQVLQDAVRYAYNTRGKLVVAAAGNSGPCSNCILYPARYAEVVAVTCTTSSESLCSFSSTGPEAELAAPGNGILSTYNSSDTSYTSLSGTSMSTPHVSGAAALAWSANQASPPPSSASGPGTLPAIWGRPAGTPASATDGWTPSASSTGSPPAGTSLPPPPPATSPPPLRPPR